MGSLLLTLGHNSSAIYIDDQNKLVSGYETERMTKKKSDSSFPGPVFSNMPAADKIYVSHWQPYGQVNWMNAKHWHGEDFSGKEIISVSHEFTHHDAHAWSALLFAGQEFVKDRTWIMVADGFGNFGEHLSLYKVVDGVPSLAQRFMGYDTSLGLLYQYTTDFLGMKMNEDEYKILGYEAHIHEVPVDWIHLQNLIEQMSNRWLKAMLKPSIHPARASCDPVISIGALAEVQLKIRDNWVKVCKELEITDATDWRGRVIISYFVQAVLEKVLQAIVFETGATNLILAGGVFYNVKANLIMAKAIPGKICVTPLAGDQGAALGLYYYHNRDFKWPGTLKWGHRALPPHLHEDIPGLEFHNTLSAAVRASEVIDDHGFVNIVKGSMEFGPRALCNTSTIAVADSMEVVNHINHINGRNTVMPFAPVMMRSTYERIFDLTNKVHKSEKYMIMALPYAYPYGELYPGAAHKYKSHSGATETIFTGRPQVIDKGEDHIMESLLREYPVLINTSFNVHGVPIVYDIQDVIKSHTHQLKADPNVVTIVVTD